MRRYQKWLSLGLLALSPSLALADEFDAEEGDVPAAAAPQKKSSSNQKLAEDVAKALRKAQLNQYEIDIDVRSGVVTLVGTIAKAEQRKAAERAVSAVPGVTKVIDRLEVSNAYQRQKQAVRQAAASMPRLPAGSSQQYIRQTNGNRPPYGGIEPGVIADQPSQPEQPVQQYQPAMPVPYHEPARVPASMPPAQLAQVPQPGRAPAANYPVSMTANGTYCPPGMQAGAGPAGTVQAPNFSGAGYAGAGYAGQQAASAWPYAGPYYPYPQIPMGWRKASLEWDDGYWNYNFRSRTDRWWWYLNPQNW